MNVRSALAILLVLGVLLGGFAASSYLIDRFVRGKRIPGLARFSIRYVVTFGSLLGLECLVLWLFPSVHQAMRDWVASVVGGAVRLAGIHALVQGSLIWFTDSPLSFDITTACLGGLLFWVYVALVMAESGITRRQRLVGLAVGLVALLAFNLFRIAASVYLEWLTGDSIHDYFYFFNMVFVLLVWAGWVWSIRPRADATPT